MKETVGSHAKQMFERSCGFSRYYLENTAREFGALLLRVEIFKLLPYGVLVIEDICSQSCFENINCAVAPTTVREKILFYVP